MRKNLVLFSLLLFMSGTKAQIISTLSGNGTAGNSGDGGPATAAEQYYPYGMSTDAAGNLYLAESGGQTIRKINTSGIISRIAGNGVQGFSGDGGPATAAEFYNTCDASSVDKFGNIYIADDENNRIRKVNTSGVITTIAGDGTYGFGGDGGPATAAIIAWPSGLAVDAAGNVLVADYMNSAIRKISTSGIMSTIAGQGISGFSGDGGPATASYLYSAIGVALDATGNIYIADSYNMRLRVINTSGIISTIAGNGVASFSGDGGPATAAEFNGLRHIAIDPSNNIIIGDCFNNCVRIINTSGIISTVAGIGGVTGFSGDNGPATAAEIYWSAGVALSPKGTIYISDQQNNRIREVTFIPSIIAKVNSNDSCSGGNNGIARVHTSGGSSPYTYLWSPGGGTDSIATGLSAGMYTVTVTDNHSNSVTATVTITQPAPITAVVDSASDDGTCDGDAGVIAGGGTPPYSYLWTPGNDTTNFIFKQCAGNYCCTITDNNGCVKVTCVTIVSTAGINNVAADNGNIAIYPNPSSGILKFDFPATHNFVSGNVEIYNVLGEKVYTQFLPAELRDSFLIDLRSNSNGIYFYRVITNEGNVLGEGKLVIQK